TARPITAEEYFQMPPPPDGSKVELVRGELITVCRPGFEHGLRQLRIGAILDHFGRSTRHGRAVVETGVVVERDPDTVRGPDVSYWSAERLPLDQVPKGYPDLAPDLAVEVLSPSNEMAKIRTRWRNTSSVASAWCGSSIPKTAPLPCIGRWMKAACSMKTRP